MRRAWIAVLVTITGSGLAAPPALATHVSCGQGIYEDTTLDSDLIDCGFYGVVIAADNVTLDLNGHTIDGRSDLGPFSRDYSQGVSNWRAHDGVTVKNGVVREFDYGVFLGAGVTPNSA